jgi:ABC-type amino acid transport substrate-binding protein
MTFNRGSNRNAAPKRFKAPARRAAAFMAALFTLLSGCGERLPPNTIKSPEDVTGSVIGAIRGSAYAALAFGIGDVRQFEDTDVMLGSLRNGQLDCVVTGATADGVKHARVKQLREPLAEYDFSFAIAKENRDLKKVVDAALESLRASGELRRIEGKHLRGENYTYTPPETGGNTGAALRAAAVTEFAPYAYIDSEGNLAGLDVDVARAVCDILGVGLEFVGEDAQEDVVTLVRYGKADIAFGGLRETEETLESVDFSVPYTTAVIGVFVRG